MTDRELLEKAAKAIGVGPTDFVWDEVCGCFWMHEGETAWNPLRDDGDALRLAVKLGIHITSSVTDAWASTLLVTATEPMGSDSYAATRRAIVRAAAAIGETK